MDFPDDLHVNQFAPHILAPDLRAKLISHKRRGFGLSSK